MVYDPADLAYFIVGTDGTLRQPRGQKWAATTHFKKAIWPGMRAARNHHLISVCQGLTLIMYGAYTLVPQEPKEKERFEMSLGSQRW